MAVAVAISSIVTTDPSQGLDKTMNEQIVDGTLTLTGNYGTGSSHGDTINFGTFDQIKSQQPPRLVEIFEAPTAGTAPLGYQYIYAQGTTQANGKLVILGTAASGSATTGSPEYTEGTAYSSGSPSLSGAVLRFRAWFPLFI